jgi:hypothetical protein
MTSDEADQRILLSRRTLAMYARMIQGQHLPLADLALFTDEVHVLENIAEDHPGKTSKMIVLVEEWIKLRERLVGLLH